MSTVHAHALQHADRWYYPSELEADLAGVDLPPAAVQETLACAWEYTRCVIPVFSNWNRYLAFTRIIVLGIVAEFRGALVDVARDDKLLNYDLDELLTTVFAGSPGREAMAQEYRSFLLVTADKSSPRRTGDLFRRYASALVQSPRTWFRMRDCDALARFTIAAALCCNELPDTWFAEAELELLAELGTTLYDAVAFYKHRAEGETNSTFAYVGEDMRVLCYRQCREILWALDAAWARAPARRVTVNFLRYFGGPIHMMMRRYRFAEEGLTVGLPETEQIVTETRQNVKLWHRMELGQATATSARYESVLAQHDRLTFPALVAALHGAGDRRCDRCEERASFGARQFAQFGGAALCDRCQQRWRKYLLTLPTRAAAVFPAELSDRRAIPPSGVGHHQVDE